MTAGEPLRFADILTNASAIANYLGYPDVTARHMLDAIAILREERSMEDVGRPQSPLVRRPGGAAGAGVTPGVRALVQRWFAELGDANAELDDEAVARFRAELVAIDREETAAGDAGS